VLQFGGVATTIVLPSKLDDSLQYLHSSSASSDATFLNIFLLAIGLGVANALCQAAAFTCK